MNGHGCVLIKLSLRDGVRAKVDCQTWAEMTTEMRLLTFRGLGEHSVPQESQKLWVCSTKWKG